MKEGPEEGRKPERSKTNTKIKVDGPAKGDRRSL